MKKNIKIPKALKFYLHQHCMKCGLKLVIRNKRFYDHGSETGESEYLYQVACPNYEWWKTDLIAFLISFRNRDGWPWHEEHRYLVCEPKKLWSSKENEMHTVILEQN